MAFSILKVERNAMEHKIFLMLIIFCAIGINSACFSGEIALQNPQEGADMNSVKKTVQDIDRYKNVSTAPSAIMIKLQDKNIDKTINVIVRNDEFYNFLITEKVVKDYEGYVSFMSNAKGKPIQIDLNNFKRLIGSGKAQLGEKYLKEYMIFAEPMSFEHLDVANEKELLNKYFDFDYSKGSGMLKGEYYEKYTRDPAFIALLLNLGYDVVWGDYVPNLNIYTEPLISHFKKSN